MHTLVSNRLPVHQLTCMQIYLDVGVAPTAFKPAGERTLGDKTVLPTDVEPVGRIVIGMLLLSTAVYCMSGLPLQMLLCLALLVLCMRSLCMLSDQDKHNATSIPYASKYSASPLTYCCYIHIQEFLLQWIASSLTAVRAVQVSMAS